MLCGRVFKLKIPILNHTGGRKLHRKSICNVRQIKHIGYQREVEAMKMLEKDYDYVFRVPMSLLPFDILCISLKRGEIVFIEVKSGNSQLSYRQALFKGIISSRNEWKVKCEVLRL